MVTLVGALKGYKKYGYLCVLISKGYFPTADAVVNIPEKFFFFPSSIGILTRFSFLYVKNQQNTNCLFMILNRKVN